MQQGRFIELCERISISLSAQPEAGLRDILHRNDNRLICKLSGGAITGSDAIENKLRLNRLRERAA